LYIFLSVLSQFLQKTKIAQKPTSTVRIRIVADCFVLSYQVTRKLKRAITLEISAISAIIFIPCCAVVLFALLIYNLLMNILFIIVHIVWIGISHLNL